MHRIGQFSFTLVVTLIIVPSIALCLPGNVYHVKQDGTGDFVTIQECADIIMAGDTCIVHSGKYNERISFSSGHSGAPGQVIAFIAEPKGSVTMQGFNTRNVDYLRIEGFCITNAPSGWLGGGLWIGSNHVEIVDNYVYDIPYAAIVGSWAAPKSEDIHIIGNKIYRSNAGIMIDGNNWLVENNEIERLFDYGNYDCDNFRFFGENHVIRGNYLHGTDLSEVGSSHVDCIQTFDNNTNGAPIRNITFEKNMCLGQFHQAFMGEAHYYDNTSDIFIWNNVFAHGSSWGLCVDSNIKNVVVYNNVFADIGYHGAGFRNNSTGTIMNNIFYDTGTSYWANSGAVITGDYNLIFDSQAPPVMGPNDIFGLDPWFADMANDNFSLLPGSPAIDSGTMVDLYEDIQGNPRPLDGDNDGKAFWDMGAYENNGSLTADVYTLSESSGGAVNFTLHAGSMHNNRDYLLLGGVSGITPGFLMPGGLVAMPLNWDACTSAIIHLMNSPILTNFSGTLDFTGRGFAKLDLSVPLYGYTGVNIYFAYCLGDPFDFASSPLRVEIVP